MVIRATIPFQMVSFQGQTIKLQAFTWTILERMILAISMTSWRERLSLGVSAKKTGMISNPGVKRKLHDMELDFFLKKQQPHPNSNQPETWNLMSFHFFNGPPTKNYRDFDHWLGFLQPSIFNFSNSLGSCSRSDSLCITTAASKASSMLNTKKKRPPTRPAECR